MSSATLNIIFDTKAAEEQLDALEKRSNAVAKQIDQAFAKLKNSAFKGLGNEIDKISNDFKQVETASRKASDTIKSSMKGSASEVANLDDQVRIAIKYMDKYGESAEKVGKQAAKAWNLSKKDATDLIKQLQKLRNNTKNLDNAYGQLHTRMRSVNKSSELMNGSWARFSVTMSGIAASLFVFQNIARGLGSLIGVGMGLEKTMAGLSQKTNMTTAQYEMLIKVARRFGSETTMSTKDALKSMSNMIEKGKSVGQAISSLYSNFEKNKSASNSIKTLDDAVSQIINVLTELNYKIFDIYGDKMRSALDNASSWIRNNEAEMIQFGDAVLEVGSAFINLGQNAFEAMRHIGSLLKTYNQFASIVGVGSSSNFNSAIAGGLAVGWMTKNPTVGVTAGMAIYAKNLFAELGKAIDKAGAESDWLKKFGIKVTKEDVLKAILPGAWLVQDSMTWVGKASTAIDDYFNVIGEAADSATKDVAVLIETVRTIDGDTITALAGGITIPIRISGIDTQESKKGADENTLIGELASKFLEDWLKEGEELIAEFLKAKDDYGRHLADLFNGGENVGLRMIDLGLADVFDEFPSEYHDEYKAAIAEITPEVKAFYSELNAVMEENGISGLLADYKSRDRFTQDQDFAKFEQGKQILDIYLPKLRLINEEKSIEAELNEMVAESQSALNGTISESTEFQGILNSMILESSAPYLALVEDLKAVNKAMETVNKTIATKMAMFNEEKDDPYFAKKLQELAALKEAMDHYAERLKDPRYFQKDKEGQDFKEDTKGAIAARAAATVKAAADEIAASDKVAKHAQSNLDKIDAINRTQGEELAMYLGQISDDGLRKKAAAEISASNERFIIALKGYEETEDASVALHRKAKAEGLAIAKEYISKEQALIKAAEKHQGDELLASQKYQDQMLQITNESIKERVKNEIQGSLDTTHAKLLADNLTETMIRQIWKDHWAARLGFAKKGVSGQAKLIIDANKGYEKAQKIIAKSGSGTPTGMAAIESHMQRYAAYLKTLISDKEKLLTLEEKEILMIVERESLEAPYRADKLQAMKSLYEDLEEISGNYFDGQMVLIAAEYNEYLKSFDLKAELYAQYTGKEKALFDSVIKWKKLKQRELVQDYMIANKGMAGGMIAYLMEMRTAWENYYQEIGQFGYDFMSSVGEAFEGSFVALFTEGTDAAKDVWAGFLDDMLESFLQMIASLMKQMILSGVLQLLASALGKDISFDSSGNAIISAGTGSVSGGSGGSISYSTLLSLAGAAYKAYAGEGFLTTLGGMLSSSAVSGAMAGYGASAAGYGSVMGSVAPQTMSAVYGSQSAAAYFGAQGAGTGAGAGASSGMGAAAAAAGWAALVVAAYMAALMIVANQDKPDASIQARGNVKIAEFQNKLFDIAITGISARGYSQGDAQKEGREMAEKLYDYFNMYEMIYQNVSIASQKKIKEGMGAIKWEDFTFTLIKIAQDYATPKLYVSGKVRPNYNLDPSGHRRSSIADARKQSGIPGSSGGAPAEVLNDLMGRYFEEYVEEALANIRGKDIFSIMSDEVLGAFDSLDKDMFINDPTAFFNNFSAAMKNMAKAELVWNDFNNWLDGTSDSMTNLEAAGILANSELEGYAAQMEALGKTLTQAELDAKFQDIFKGITDGITDLNADGTLSGLEQYLAAINGQFDAYLDLLKEYGVDLEKIEDLEGKRAKKLEEAAEEYIKIVTEALENAIESAINLIGELETTVSGLNSTFAGIIAGWAKDNPVSAIAATSIVKIYEEIEAAIVSKQEEISAIMEPFAEETALISGLLDDAKNGVNAEGLIAYFEKLKRIWSGEEGVNLDAMALSLSGSFAAAAAEMEREFRILQGMELEHLSRYAQFLGNTMQEFADNVPDMDITDMEVGLDKISGYIENYREAIENTLNSWDIDLSYEARSYLQDVLGYLDSLDAMITSFQNELASLSKATIREVAENAAGSFDGVADRLNSTARRLNDASGIMKGIQEETLALSAQITDWVSALADTSTVMSNADILAGFTAISDSIDALITSVEDIRLIKLEAGDGPWVDFLDSYLDYLRGLKSSIDFFESELEKAGDSEAMRVLIAGILRDLNSGDFESAIAFLQKALDDLIAGGGSAEEIARLRSELQALKDLKEEFYQMELKQLDAIKRALGLMTDSDFTDKRYEQLKKTYGKIGLDPSDAQTAKDMIAAFANMSLDEIKYWADELGITWQELAEDIAFLVEQENKLADIRRAQAELSGKDTALWDISSRYNIDYDDIDQNFAASQVSTFLNMTEEQIVEWAAALGVSTAQLIADMLALASAFGLTGEAAADEVITIYKAVTPPYDLQANLRALHTAYANEVKRINDMRGELGEIAYHQALEDLATKLKNTIDGIMTDFKDFNQSIADYLRTQGTKKGLKEYYDYGVEDVEDAAYNSVYSGIIDGIADSEININSEQLPLEAELVDDEININRDQLPLEAELVDNDVNVHVTVTVNGGSSAEVSGQQYAKGGVATGPNSGYIATLHGTELVVSQTSKYPVTIADDQNDEQTVITKAAIADIPKFADGGTATGPDSGYLAMLHGTETVTPAGGSADSSESNRSFDWIDKLKGVVDIIVKTSQGLTDAVGATKSELEDLVKALEDKKDELKYSDFNLALPKEIQEVAAFDYAEALAAAIADPSDTDAVNKFMDAIDPFLQKSQDTFKSSQVYQDIFNTVMSDLDDVKGKVAAAAAVAPTGDEEEGEGEDDSKSGGGLGGGAGSGTFEDIQMTITDDAAEAIALLKAIYETYGTTATGLDLAFRAGVVFDGDVEEAISILEAMTAAGFDKDFIGHFAVGLSTEIPSDWSYDDIKLFIASVLENAGEDYAIQVAINVLKNMPDDWTVDTLADYFSFLEENGLLTLEVVLAASQNLPDSWSGADVVAYINNIPEEFRVEGAIAISENIPSSWLVSDMMTYLDYLEDNSLLTSDIVIAVSQDLPSSWSGSDVLSYIDALPERFQIDAAIAVSENIPSSWTVDDMSAYIGYLVDNELLTEDIVINVSQNLPAAWTQGDVLEYINSLPDDFQLTGAIHVSMNLPDSWTVGDVGNWYDDMSEKFGPDQAWDMLLNVSESIPSSWSAKDAQEYLLDIAETSLPDAIEAAITISENIPDTWSVGSTTEYLDWLNEQAGQQMAIDAAINVSENVPDSWSVHDTKEYLEWLEELTGDKTMAVKAALNISQNIPSEWGSSDIKSYLDHIKTEFSNLDAQTAAINIAVNDENVDMTSATSALEGFGMTLQGTGWATDAVVQGALESSGFNDTEIEAAMTAAGFTYKEGGYGASATVEATVDAEGVTDGAATAAKEVAKIDGDTATVIIDGDSDDFEDVLYDAKKEVERIDGDTTTIIIDGDSDDLEDVLYDAKKEVEGMDKELATVSIDGDSDDLEDALYDVTKEVAKIDGDTATVIIDGDSDDLEDVLYDAKKEVEGMDQEFAIVSIDGDEENLTDVINTATTAISEFDELSATIDMSGDPALLDKALTAGTHNISEFDAISTITDMAADSSSLERTLATETSHVNTLDAMAPVIDIKGDNTDAITKGNNAISSIDNLASPTIIITGNAASAEATAEAERIIIDAKAASINVSAADSATGQAELTRQTIDAKAASINVSSADSATGQAELVRQNIDAKAATINVSTADSATGQAELVRQGIDAKTASINMSAADTTATSNANTIAGLLDAKTASINMSAADTSATSNANTIVGLLDAKTASINMSAADTSATTNANTIVGLLDAKTASINMSAADTSATTDTNTIAGLLDAKAASINMSAADTSATTDTNTIAGLLDAKTASINMSAADTTATTDVGDIVTDINLTEADVQVGADTSGMIDDIKTDLSNGYFSINVDGSLSGSSSSSSGRGNAEGGVVSGPKSGYMSLLHGTEAIVPLPKGSIPVELLGMAEMITPDVPMANLNLYNAPSDSESGDITINLQIVTEDGEVTREDVIKIARNTADEIRVKANKRKGYNSNTRRTVY